MRDTKNMLAELYSAEELVALSFEGYYVAEIGHGKFSGIYLSNQNTMESL